jgi:hypothetical protein
MSSCFLLAMKADSIVGIYDTLKQCAVISKAAGGIGLSVHNIRAHGSYIKGTKGTSNGLVPMLRVFDVTARYVDQVPTPPLVLMDGCDGRSDLRDWAGGRQAAGGLRHISGAVACRHFRGAGPQEKPRQGGGAGAGLVLRAVDPRPFHEEG